MKIISSLSFLVLMGSLCGCGIQSIPQANNQLEAAWAEVQNQYKRRADLVPNLVEVVKGYAKHEKSTLTEVVEARAKATSITVDPQNLTPEKLKAFQSAQGQLSQALGRLMVVAEKYPDLKANENFRDLQSQLEGTENRITVARNRYIDSVRQFNNLVTVFPTSITNNLFFKYQKKAQFEATTEEQKTPKVSF